MQLDSASILITGRLGIAVLLVFGGWFALTRGYKLYADGKGSAKESTALQIGNWHVTTSTAGAAVMPTASFWGTLAWLETPGLKEAQHGAQGDFSKQITRLYAPNGQGYALIEPTRSTDKKYSVLFDNSTKWTIAPLSLSENTDPTNIKAFVLYDGDLGQNCFDVYKQQIELKNSPGCPTPKY